MLQRMPPTPEPQRGRPAAGPPAWHRAATARPAVYQWGMGEGEAVKGVWQCRRASTDKGRRVLAGRRLSAGGKAAVPLPAAPASPSSLRRAIGPACRVQLLARRLCCSWGVCTQPRRARGRVKCSAANAYWPNWACWTRDARRKQAGRAQAATWPPPTSCERRLPPLPAPATLQFRAALRKAKCYDCTRAGSGGGAVQVAAGATSGRCHTNGPAWGNLAGAAWAGMKEPVRLMSPADDEFTVHGRMAGEKACLPHVSWGGATGSALPCKQVRTLVFALAACFIS